MRTEVVTFLTEGNKVRNSNGFVSSSTVRETTLTASLLSNRLSDETVSGTQGWHIDLKVAVDLYDYETTFLTDSAGKTIRPQKLTHNGITYLIKKPTANFKTHQMELLCTEVE